MRAWVVAGRQRRRRTKPATFSCSSLKAALDTTLCSQTWAALIFRSLSSTSFFVVGDHAESVGLFRWAAASRPGGERPSGERLGVNGLAFSVCSRTECSFLVGGETSIDSMRTEVDCGDDFARTQRQIDCRPSSGASEGTAPQVCGFPYVS